MIELATIRQPIGPLPGGTARMFIIPWQGVDSVPVAATDGVIYDDIVRKAGKQFVQYDFNPGTCQLSTPSRGSGGAAWLDTLVDLSIAGDDQPRLGQFQRMLNGLFVIVLDQGSGRVKLCGDDFLPLLCEQASYQGGGNPGDANGTRFQFRGRGVVPKEYRGGIGITEWRVKRDSVYCLED